MYNSYKIEYEQVRGILYTKESLDNGRLAKCNTKSRPYWSLNDLLKHYNECYPKKKVNRYIKINGRTYKFMNLAEVIMKINELGGNIKSDSTLRKYHAANLIPKPTHRGAGRGQGSVTDYPVETPAEFRASQLMRKGSIIRLQPEYLSKIREAALSIGGNTSFLESRTRKGLVIKDEEGKEVNINEDYEAEEVIFSTDKDTYDFLIGKGSFGTISFEENLEMQYIPNKSIKHNTDAVLSAEWLRNKLKGLAGFNPNDESVYVGCCKVNPKEYGGEEEFIITITKRK